MSGKNEHSVEKHVDEARTNLFGHKIQDTDYGFYVALEFFALVRGICDVSRDDVLTPAIQGLRYRRITHDWARRVATGDLVFEDESVSDKVDQQRTLDAAKELLASLLVVEPGQKKKSKVWKSRHFFPFDGQMVHYDAVERGTGPNRQVILQEQVFRGAGRWVYKALRDDPEGDRRQQTARRLRDILGVDRSALGGFFGTVAKFDEASASEDDFPNLEKYDLFSDRTKWVELLRSGVHHIVERQNVTQAARVNDLMHWIPFCLLRHVLDLAYGSLDMQKPLLAIDVQPTDMSNQLRTQSQNQVKEFLSVISNAVSAAARDSASAALQEDVDFESEIANQSKVVRSFFTRSSYAVGLLNSDGGLRHFTMTAPLRSAIVAALIEPDEPMVFKDFSRKVLDETGLVIGSHKRTSASWTTRIDNGVLSQNEEVFAAHLQAAGLLTKYSDTTSMVHREVGGSL